MKSSKMLYGNYCLNHKDWSENQHITILSGPTPVMVPSQPLKTKRAGAAWPWPFCACFLNTNWSQEHLHFRSL